ncbi:MAG: cytochrome C oxidase subunit IV family protein [Bacteroidia bacterium]|nr:cytochrome C oxidase subunit IV family protein [Bacteroidia bacterium]MDW8157859.1 cytochrome C oxidase subunit IV family protein [Bacteroidia bacterium]
MEHNEHVEHVQHEVHGTVFQRIIVPFIILSIVTVIEFLVAFTLSKGGVKIAIFVVLTLVKAFYIVAYFMHVKFERLNFIYAVTLPFLFIVYLLVLLLIEGKYQDVFAYGVF